MSDELNPQRMISMSADEWAALCQGDAAYSDLAPAMLAVAVIRERNLLEKQSATPSQPVGDMQEVEALADNYAHMQSAADSEGFTSRADEINAGRAAQKSRESLLSAIRKLLEAKGEDAERYQWLRDESPHHASYPPTATLTVGHGIKVVWQGYGDRFKPTLHLDGKGLDAAIDAARKEVKP